MTDGEEYISTRLHAACMDLRVAAELMYLDGHGTDATILEIKLEEIKAMISRLGWSLS
jgi:hypothetical protein